MLEMEPMAGIDPNQPFRRAFALEFLLFLSTSVKEYQAARPPLDSALPLLNY